MLTKLTAVNAMLAAVGEAPISTLEDPSADAEIAVAVLDEITNDIQEVGWNCNTDYDVMLAPDDQGRVELPYDTIRFTPSGWYNGARLSVRVDPTDGIQRVWDDARATFLVGYGVKCQIVHELAFEALSPALRTYAKCKAARVYQTRIMGATQLDRYLARDETEAFIRLSDDESENEPTNIISSDYTLAWGRRHARSPI